MTAGDVRTLTVRAAAKINLHLGVGAVRADGYHPIDTVFHAVSLFDDVSARSGTEGAGPVLDVEGSDHVDLTEVPLDSRNLVHAAATRLAREERRSPDVRIGVHKSIPVAGGLAGGSADAAATLVALDRLWGLELEDQDLLRVAAELGSDVPFALLGGTARGTGRGDVLQRVDDRSTWWWVLVTSPQGLSTPAVYRRFDELFPTAPARPTSGDAVERAVHSGDPVRLARVLHNDLEPAAFDLRPGLADLVSRGEAAGALKGMVSGSGPTCAFLCADAEAARAVCAELRETERERSAADARRRTVLVTTGPAPGVHQVAYERR
ncbi:4-(cytidine 5'-diphospho)-2-C-methyl-D-erythritol kinase [Nocardioides sp. CFH 31398]|uniref:4-(cytidine 5'-diphospho)-2-C-methyl-D-erythritol kinase n=1 Tax=Nocardioides sp. CFH 31398 TaxID=2919579 RepID=UPI001F0613FB|nr:4-(cytidine 5'-diphospho)-2-C-methyl-D-erythritol kinase [Nocardioides sp. CFH 31398]MCH1865352.1 4-(cytidine 5'-diphospho)-2-C-methyl-D-erythritol kinase [Nocardioides sp. CFH 31398]